VLIVVGVKIVSMPSDMATTLRSMMA